MSLGADQPSRQVMLIVEFDRELTPEELDIIVPIMSARIREHHVPEHLPIPNANPVRIYGGAMVTVDPNDFSSPPPLRPE
jgi:hypothetical protein